MLMNNEAITVFGDGKTGRDYTYVDDIVNGIISAISYDQSNYEIFNLGNRIEITYLDERISIAYEISTNRKLNWDLID